MISLLFSAVAQNISPKQCKTTIILFCSHFVDQEFAKGFSGGSVVKKSIANAGDTGLIPELGKSPGKEPTGVDPLQYSCLGNPMARQVMGSSKSWT